MDLLDPNIKIPVDIYSQYNECLESAKGEREVTNFIKQHLYLLSRLDFAWNAKYAKSEVMLGADYKVDFLCLSAHSGAWIVRLIEAQSPNDDFFTKKMHETEQLAEARKQIVDWKNWIDNNFQNFREILSEIVDIDCPAWCSNASVHQKARTELVDKKTCINFRYTALIGRRKYRTHEKNQYLSESKIGFEVVTYDRILDYAKQFETK